MASTSRRIAASTGAQIIGRLTSSAIGIITVGLSTRYLGPQSYGALTAATVFIGIFGTFTDVGISNIAVREMAQKPERADHIVGNVLALRAVMGIAMILIAVGLAPLLYHDKNDIIQATVILSLTLLLQSIQTSLSAVLTAQIRGYLTVVGDIVSKIVIVAAIIMAIRLHLGFIGVVDAYLIGAVVSFMSDCFFSLRAVRPRFKPEKAYIKHIIKLTLPFSAAVILNTIYFNIDGFMLSVMRPIVEVGLYGVAYKVVQLTMSFAIFFATAVFPLMAAAANDHKRLSDLVDKTARALGMLAAPVVLGVIAVAPEAIRLLGGKGFAAAALPMSILMVGNYFVYLNTGYGNALLASNHQNMLVRITGITFVVNVISNLILIPAFGVNGAASSVVVAEVAQLMVLRMYYRSFIGRPYPLRRQIGPLLSGAGMFVVVVAANYLFTLAHINWLIVLVASVACGAVFYAGVVVVTKQLRMGELRELIGRPA